ncbi:MAG: S9 family peptidase [Saprospiraceae bacterium]|nr:S9 family peptidase [Saprospiraceae bacterium]
MQYLSPLVDREVFFGNPEISGAQISPNGQFIAFIKPYNGIMNIWIKSFDQDFDEALPLTDDTNRPIRSFFWSRDSQYLLYSQDKGGDENFHIYAVQPTDAEAGFIPKSRDLSPYENITAYILHVPKSNHNKLFVAINDRDTAWHDYYSIDIPTGERTLLLQNDNNWTGAYFDLEDKLQLLSKSNETGGSEIFHLKDGKPQRILQASLEENVAPIRFDKAGNVYVVSNIGDVNFTGLYLYNFELETLQFIESDPDNYVDLENAIFSDLTDELIATVYLADQKKILWKNEPFREDYQYLKSQFPDYEIDITSLTEDESKWIIFVHKDTDPGKAYTFERAGRSIVFQYAPRPELENVALVPMQSIKYNSIDGLEIPAYLTIPDVADPKNLPAVIFPHGGPWARDYWGYNGYAQFLANRGYVVLQPNFRGSTGYGKAFLNAAINEWGQKMQDDLTAGAQYLIQKGIAQSDKIAIMGGSYGGYATLAGLSFTPEVYAAGVSIVGPSNLFTLLETIPPYWESARVMFHKRMGDPTTEEGKAQLQRQSPFFHAQNIKAPLLVAQGDNDPRVKTSESDQIVIAMRDLGLAVEYLNFPDEGHGFANPDNNMSFIAVMEAFLAKHLGGRYQENVPEQLQTIIRIATVDINALKMPTIVTDSMRLQSNPAIVKRPSEGTLHYNLSLEIQGQNMEFTQTREVKATDTHLTIQESAESPMGDMRDLAVCDIQNMSLERRTISQDPVEIEIDSSSSVLYGKYNINGRLNEINLDIEGTTITDGAHLDIYLSCLDFENLNQNTIRVFDAQQQAFVIYEINSVGEVTIDQYRCHHIQLSALEGSTKKMDYYISIDDQAILVQKESVLPQMGGAKIIMKLNYESA